MTDYIVTETELINVANAIRAKGGTVADLEWPTGYIAAINAIPMGGGGVTIVGWATGTDEEIAAMIDAAHNGDIDLQQDGGWAVGDVRTIHISTFTDGANVSHAAQDIDIVLTSFDEYMECGNVVQFDFKDVLKTSIRMNSNATNVGGYGVSEMKSTTLPALVGAMPNWIKTRLREFPVLASDGGGMTPNFITVPGNKLALRSANEVYGNGNYYVPGDGTQLAYYQTAPNRIKNANGSNQAWWTRTTYTADNASYIAITASGSYTDYYPTSYWPYLAPFGCL